jgi:hypothetical protein
MTVLQEAVMVTRRNFVAILCSLSISLPVSAFPYKLGLSGAMLELAPQSALAKNGGNGRGGGSSGGSGGGKGGGNSGGNSGGKGGGSSKGSSSRSSGSIGSGAKETKVEEGGSVLRVRHVDGISEEIDDGRYIMKDSRGRTIVDRRATTADKRRLQSFID